MYKNENYTYPFLFSLESTSNCKRVMTDNYFRLIPNVDVIVKKKIEKKTTKK